MAKIGYARTSSTGQHINLQVEKLKAFGCVEPGGLIFADQQNIPDIDDRTELQACLEHIQNGDLLVVTKLDRLTHSTKKLNEISRQLHKKGAGLIAIDQDINTRTLAGRLLLKYCLLSRKL